MSISYELAKKLKELGFSQEKRAGGYFMSSGEIKDKTYNPTLSELIGEVIEKCASLMLSTSLLREGWRAEGQLREATGGKQFDEFGLTPEEAVANLWLKLHEKK